MSAVGAALLAAAFGWLTVRPPPNDRQRGMGARTGHERHDSAARSWVEDPRRRTAICVLGCVLVGSTVAGLVGACVGVVVGLAAARAAGRLERPSVAIERRQIAHDLPLAIDLIAACSEVGLPVQTVLPQVARAVGGPLGQRFEQLQARWTLGASPLEEWQRLADDPALRRLGAAMVRAHRSGAPLSRTLDRLAVDTRRERRTQALSAARSVGVRVAAPLAACFLPAFMAVGVVPTVVGGFAHLGL